MVWTLLLVLAGCAQVDGAIYHAPGHYPNSLMRNNGNGTFDDVTEEAGMLSFSWPGNHK